MAPPASSWTDAATSCAQSPKDAARRIRPIGVRQNGQSLRVGRRRKSERGSTPPEKSLTAGEATRRIKGLRHVYEEGYIPWQTFESIKRAIEARVRRTDQPKSS